MKKYIVSSETIGGKEKNHEYVKLAHSAGAVVEWFTSSKWKAAEPLWNPVTLYRAIVTDDMPKEIQDMVNFVGDHPVCMIQSIGRGYRANAGQVMKWADVIKAMADGIPVECQWSDGTWNEPGPNNPISQPGANWRIKPSTIMIAGIEVPEPLRVAPEKDTTYFVADPASDDLFYAETWDCDSIDIRYLRRGQCHATEDAAIAHAKALVVVSGGEV